MTAVLTTQCQRPLLCCIERQRQRFSNLRSIKFSFWLCLAHAHVLHEGLVKAELAIADLVVREIVSHVAQITREDGEAVRIEERIRQGGITETISR